MDSAFQKLLQRRGSVSNCIGIPKVIANMLKYVAEGFSLPLLIN